MSTLPQLFASAWRGDLAEPNTEPGPCELCGAVGVTRVKWRPQPNWTAQDTHAYPGAGAICLGCDLLVRGKSPEVSGRSGRPLRWTLFTIAATSDGGCGWMLKDRKREIADWITRPGAAVSVADGGQKHTAYMVPGPGPDGTITAALDGRVVRMPTRDWADLTRTVTGAYRGGATKAGLLAPRLPHADIRRLGIANARRVEDALTPHRRTAALDLAVWLATKEEDA